MVSKNTILSAKDSKLIEKVIIKHGDIPAYSIQLNNGWNNLHNPVIWFY